jgi:hypothetical protein
VPLEAHIKEHPAYFKRFNAVWTPTVLILDPDGHECWRIEGYLPKDEFRAQLLMGLARIAVIEKRWADAEKLYGQVVDQFPNTTTAAEALYWRNVSQYSQSHQPQPLQSVASELRQKYPDSVWAKKASVWSTAA